MSANKEEALLFTAQALALTQQVFSDEELMNAGIYNPLVRRDFATELYYFKVRK